MHCPSPREAALTSHRRTVPSYHDGGEDGLVASSRTRCNTRVASWLNVVMLFIMITAPRRRSSSMNTHRSCFAEVMASQQRAGLFLQPGKKLSLKWP